MSDAFGWKALKVLSQHSLVHDIAKELHLPLDDAYNLQHWWITFWQKGVLPSRPDLEKEKAAEWIREHTHTIDVGYKAVKLIIPREWDRHARRIIITADLNPYEAWLALWQELAHMIWLTEVKKKKEAPEVPRIGLWQSRYPLEHGRLRVSERKLYTRKK